MIKLRRTRVGVFIATIAWLSVSLLTSASTHAQTLANNSFESPLVSANTDSLRPMSASWMFSGQSGIRNNSAPNGSDGRQAAFLSAAPLSGNNNFGSIRQTLTLKPGTYYVRYLGAVKSPTGRSQPVQFYVNGVARGGALNSRYITDATTGGFEAGWTQPFVVTAAGSYELRFDATNATNYGTTAAPLYAVAYLDAVTLISVPTGFANAGFEAADSWTLSSGAATATASDAPEGVKVLSMTAAATASQSLALPAGRYGLSVKLGKASAAAGTLNLEVASNGAAAVTVATVSATTAAEYRSYSTVGFALPSGNHVFTLRASGSSFSVDAVALNDVGPDAGNAGFETPVVAAPSSATAAGPTIANPTTAIWTFSGTGGLIQANAGSSNVSAPRTIAGKQYLALTGTGAVAQSLAFAAGTYVAVSQVAQGGFKVLVDGAQVGKLSVSTLDFRELMSAPFVVAAGTRSLSLAVDTTYSPATPKLDEFRLLRVDVPPAVSITAPANGAVFQTGATVDITASASDPDGISNLAISRTPTGGSAAQLATSASSPLSTSWSNSSANGYTITASATDSTGATSSTSINIRVNANPSAIVSVSPTGPVVTSATAVTATVTVASASDADGAVTKIEFLQDAVVATTCTKTIPPAVAPFTCAHSLPPRAAAYSLTVRVTDNDGGTATTSPLTLRINTPPAVTLTAACVAPCGAPGTVNLAATPTDTDGTIAKVEFYDGATLLTTKTASPWTYAHATATTGSHSYTAKAFDNDGASASSSAQTVTVTAPVPSVALTASCATPCNAPAAVALTAVPSNITGTISKVEFYDGATLLTADTSSPYSFAAASVTAATHSYTAKVYITGTTPAVATSTAQTVRVNALPTVTLTASCVAPCSSPGTVNLTATPADADGTIAKVEFYDSATLLSTKTASPWTYAHTTVTTGSHSYTARAFDNDNASTTSSAQTVTVVAPVPSLALTASCTAPCNAPAAVNLAAVPSNISGTISKVEFYDGTTLLSSDTSSPYSFAAASVAAAMHSYTAKVYVTGTTAAVATSAAQTVRVNALPTVTLSATCVAPCSAPGTVNLTAAPVDTDGTISKVEFYDGATLLATTTASPWVYSHTTATVGTHNYTAKAFDNDNASKTSTTQSVSVVALPPSVALTASCTAPCTTPATVQLAAAPANIVGTISKVEFYDGATLLGADTTSPYALSVASVAAATHSYSAKVYVTGNTTALATSPAVALTVNPNNGLTVNLTVWANPVVGNNQAIDMVGDAASLPGSIVSIDFYANGVQIGTGILRGSYINADGSYGDYANYTWRTTAAGTYTLTVRATDSVGNVSVSPGKVVTVSPISVTVTNPTENLMVDQPGPVMLTATATTTVGAITKVEFFRGGDVLIGAATTAPYTYRWQNMAAGEYAITAKATTSSGAALASDSVFIIVFDPTPASFTVNNPLPGFEIWAEQNYAVNGTISGPSGTTVSGTLDYSGTLSNGTVCGPCTGYPFSANASAGAFSGTFSHYSEAVGAMVLNVVATTPKGTTTRKTVNGTSRFSHIKITNPPYGEGDDSQTTASSITVTGEFDVFSAPIISVNGVAATISGRQFTATGVPLAMGRNAVTATLVGTSDAGSTITRTDIRTVYRYEPSQLPTVTITQPVGGGISYADRQNSATITASSPGCTPVMQFDCISVLDFYVDGVLVRTARNGYSDMFIQSNSWYHTYELSWTATLGTHTLVARARDSNGLWNSSDPVTVNALSALTLTTLSPQSGGFYPLASATALSVQVKDLIGVVSSATVRIDGASPVTLTADPAFPYGYPNYERRYQATLEQLGLTQTLGSHSITVEATQGGRVLLSQTTAFTLAAKYDGVLDGISLFQNSTVGAPVALRTSGLIAGVAPTRVEYIVNGQVLDGGSSAPFVKLWKPAVAGTYYLSVRAYDSSGNRVVSAETTLYITDAPQVTQQLYRAPVGRSTFHGSAIVTQGSTITVNGLIAQLDAAGGQFFVDDVLFGPGDNVLNIVITDMYGRQTTRTITVVGASGYNSNFFRASVSPSFGQVPFAASLTTRNPDGLSFDNVRVNCDSTRTPLTTTYAQTAIVDGVPFATCNFINAGVNVVKFEYLGSYDSVVQTQLRPVMAHAPVNDAARALTTYYSFLSLLLDNNLTAAVSVGFASGARTQWQATLAALSVADRSAYAAAMFNVRSFRVYSDFAELVVALPIIGGSATEPYAVRLTVDADGFWRIEGL